MKKMHKFYFYIIINNQILSITQNKISIKENNNNKILKEQLLEKSSSTTIAITPFKKNILDKIYKGDKEFLMNYTFDFNPIMKKYLISLFVIHFFITEIDMFSIKDNKDVTHNLYLHVNLFFHIIIYYFYSNYFLDNYEDIIPLNIVSLIFKLIKKLFNLTFIFFLQSTLIGIIYFNIENIKDEKNFSNILLQNHNHYIYTYFYLFIILAEIWKYNLFFYTDLSKKNKIQMTLKKNSVKDNKEIKYYNNQEIQDVLLVLCV